MNPSSCSRTEAMRGEGMRTSSKICPDPVAQPRSAAGAAATAIGADGTWWDRGGPYPARHHQALVRSLPDGLARRLDRAPDPAELRNPDVARGAGRGIGDVAVQGTTRVGD